MFLSFLIYRHALIYDRFCFAVNSVSDYASGLSVPPTRHSISLFDVRRAASLYQGPAAARADLLMQRCPAIRRLGHGLLPLHGMARQLEKKCPSPSNPLGAQKEKKAKKMKSIESPRKKKSPKASSQIEPKRSYEHQRYKDPTERNQEAMSKSCAAHQRTPSPHPNGKPKGSEGLAQPERRHFSAQ